MKITATHHCHGGTLQYVEHDAKSTNCKMRYSIFLPQQAQENPCPALLFLSGLTCTEDNFTTKAAAYQKAMELGLIIIAPDTSPRGENIPDDNAYDLGKGASFYINATKSPWQEHYQMETYIAEELRTHLLNTYNINPKKLGITGHSMGGHGALTLYLKYPNLFTSVSAFSPICAPTECDWGKKAFSAYLGDKTETWKSHDATHLMTQSKLPNRQTILIDQGENDPFLAQNQLNPKLFEAACKSVSHPLTLRIHKHYDHSYFFIQTFINDHIIHHFTSSC